MILRHSFQPCAQQATPPSRRLKSLRIAPIVISLSVLPEGFEETQMAARCSTRYSLHCKRERDRRRVVDADRSSLRRKLKDDAGSRDHNFAGLLGANATHGSFPSSPRSGA